MQAYIEEEEKTGKGSDKMHRLYKPVRRARIGLFETALFDPCFSEGLAGELGRQQSLSTACKYVQVSPLVDRIESEYILRKIPSVSRKLL